MDAHFTPPILLVLPFVTLLLMVATGPVLYPSFWHRYYAFIAPGLSLVVVGYYLCVLGHWEAPMHALMEYVQFILLLGALYMISGSILIRLRVASSPRNNLGFLWAGAVLANFIGTTGASMLLIRPYMRLNRGRLSVYHIVFFIFMVSNMGGALTPIGDPPLFLGYLKGVDFAWPLLHAFLPWMMGLVLLSAIFYGLDRGGKRGMCVVERGSWVEVRGGRFFLLFFVVIGAVFLDPTKWDWVPSLGGVSYVRELILLGVIGVTYWLGNREVLKANDFSLEPLKEVVFIFIGIFGTMMPAMAWISYLAGEHREWLSPNSLYWGTGIFSSVLDNAPTYVSFLTAGMRAHDLDVNVLGDVGVLCGVLWAGVVGDFAGGGLLWGDDLCGEWSELYGACDCGGAWGKDAEFYGLCGLCGALFVAGACGDLGCFCLLPWCVFRGLGMRYSYGVVSLAC